MSQAGWRIVGILGFVAVGVAVGEHVARGVVERRYHQVIESRRRLELQFGEALARAGKLEDDVRAERRRSQELFGALGAARTLLEEAVGRLSQEAQRAQEFRARLASKEQQMDQLQGELAAALQRREVTEPREPRAIQLDRIVVRDTEARTLEGRVVSVHPDWNFVVLSFGWDAVRIGDTVSIFRDQQLLAQARVDRVQQAVCAATLLPEWRQAEIHINDLARVL